MSVLVDRNSRILIQGITGATGRAYAERMAGVGSPLVGGTSVNKAGQVVCGVPVFATMAEAVAVTGGNCVLSAVRNANALDAMVEVFDAGIPLAVLYTENVPVHDAIKMCAYARSKGGFLLGPNSAGVITPGQANIADIHDHSVRPGRIGIVSKSGTLTYEVFDSLHEHGFGESSIVCLGGDRVVGTTFLDILKLFERDPETDAVVLVGEPGGSMEYAALDFIGNMTKPVVAYITGQHAPAQKRMGHAGAISGEASEKTTAAAKLIALAEAGCVPVQVVTNTGAVMATVLARSEGAR
ncbi:MAG: succinate--CoA ligase subunit alpha [Proteobacteria bacterium]|nr:succinate--CoA ligase subunit alpha [Pseudomonadota bacterium]